jgi:hypothetical protein
VDVHALLTRLRTQEQTITDLRAENDRLHRLLHADEEMHTALRDENHRLQERQLARKRGGW